MIICELLAYVLKNSSNIAECLCQHYISSRDLVLFSDDHPGRTANLARVIANSEFGLHSNLRTAEGDSILQLVGNSKLCILHMTSALVLKMLDNFPLFRLSQPYWRTADGDNLSELMCQSKTYVSSTSSESLFIHQ